MKHATILLFLLLVPGHLFAQSFSPEVSLKSGIHRISDYSYSPDYEQKNTVMYEVEVFHPVFSPGKTIVSLGINGSLRRESDFLKADYCLDCSEFSSKSHAVGARLKLSTTKTPVVFSFYSGINHNQVSIKQLHYGLIPAGNIELPPLLDIQETYLNLDTGFRMDIPIHQSLYFSSDFRLYFPLDDSDFNQRRTALSAGLSLKF